MTPLPLTLALFTSTRGHFGRDTYRDTVTDWLRQLPANSWEGLHANVKWEPGEEAKRDEMVAWLEQRRFVVTATCKAWKHHDPSHQEGYIADILTAVNEITTSYYLHLEDDWFIRADEPIERYLSEAIEMLEEHPGCIQVRFARWVDEANRIRGLKAKHGLDVKVFESADGSFSHGDWSNHPFIARTRDVNAAIRFVFATSLPKHSEHGFGAAMKLLGWPDQPFHTPDPSNVWVRHRGTILGEEDPLDKPLFSS